jgi:hypothetical protein
MEAVATCVKLSPGIRLDRLTELKPSVGLHQSKRCDSDGRITFLVGIISHTSERGFKS